MKKLLVTTLLAAAVTGGHNKADINYVNMDSDGDISIKYTLDGEKKGYCFNINSGDKKVLI